MPVRGSRQRRRQRRPATAGGAQRQDAPHPASPQAALTRLSCSADWERGVAAVPTRRELAQKLASAATFQVRPSRVRMSSGGRVPAGVEVWDECQEWSGGRRLRRPAVPTMGSCGLLKPRAPLVLQAEIRFAVALTAPSRHQATNATTPERPACKGRRHNCSPTLLWASVGSFDNIL